jgi:hypothetical protein
VADLDCQKYKFNAKEQNNGESSSVQDWKDTATVSSQRLLAGLLLVLEAFIMI